MDTSIESRETSPQTAHIAAVPAGFGERFLAYVIDGLPFVICCNVSLRYMIRNMGFEYNSATVLKWYLVWIFVYILYQAILSSGGRATVGKWLLGLRIRAKDGGNLGFFAAILRAIGYFLSSALFEFGYLLAFFTPQKRALHDYIAGSAVIRLRPRSDFANGLIFALAWGVFGLLASAWCYNNIIRLSPSEQRRMQAARRGIERIAGLEELYRKQYGAYTNDISRLAALSGDVKELRENLLRVLEPELEILADPEHYLITGRFDSWRNRFRLLRWQTEVQLAGP